MTQSPKFARRIVLTWTLNDSVGHNELSCGADTTFYRTYFYIINVLLKYLQQMLLHWHVTPPIITSARTDPGIGKGEFVRQPGGWKSPNGVQGQSPSRRSVEQVRIQCWYSANYTITTTLLSGRMQNIVNLVLQSTNVLRAIVACGVSLSNAAHASQSAQSNTPRRPSQSGTSHWVSWHHAYINLLTVITHAQQLQSNIVHG